MMEISGGRGGMIFGEGKDRKKRGERTWKDAGAGVGTRREKEVDDQVHASACRTD
jgi:hypothetical protein